MIKHWLHGEIKLKHEIAEETRCIGCLHSKVCDRSMGSRCLNFKFSTSNGNPSSCDQCIHRFTRFDRDPIPCFACGDFLEAKNG